MNNREIFLLGAGVVVGFFVKRTLDNRNALALANRVDSLPADTNYVFSQKYKDCEAKVEQQLASTEFKVTANFDMNAYKKNAIDNCMKGGAL